MRKKNIYPCGHAVTMSLRKLDSRRFLFYFFFFDGVCVEGVHAQEPVMTDITVSFCTAIRLHSLARIDMGWCIADGWQITWGTFKPPACSRSSLYCWD